MRSSSSRMRRLTTAEPELGLNVGVRGEPGASLRPPRPPSGSGFDEISLSADRRTAPERWAFSPHSVLELRFWSWSSPRVCDDVPLRYLPGLQGRARRLRVRLKCRRRPLEHRCQRSLSLVHRRRAGGEVAGLGGRPNQYAGSNDAPCLKPNVQTCGEPANDRRGLSVGVWS